MDKFLRSLNFERVDKTTWIRKSDSIDLRVVIQQIGDARFVNVVHGYTDEIRYFRTALLGLSFESLRDAIADAIAQQKIRPNG